ncbi:MAG: hypothetical protein AB1916_16680 [Thermodesulfobacteriota bacterium]
MNTEVNRYKVNQEAQAVLVRNGADLATLSYSFTGQTLYLSGSLLRGPDDQFTPEEVRGLAQDLLRHPHIGGLQFDLDNWVVTQEFGVFSATPLSREKQSRR